ncbi:MAG: hypothetical protein ABW208_21235 [Pyrinomonadaceae bacterium]
MTARSKATLLFGLCVWAALMGSCQYSLDLWVIPGSTAENLVFGFAGSRKGEEKVRPQSIRVFTCEAVKKAAGQPGEAEALWQAEVPQGGSAEPVNRITYGRGEHGLETRRGPSPLAAGCYAAFAYGRDERDDLRAAGLRFEVKKDGKVIER